MASTPAPPTPASAPNVELLFGPMLIGVLLNTTLYGVSLVQMLMYYTRYKRDRKWFRYLALYLLIAETANTVFNIGLIYEPLIMRYGQLESFLCVILRPGLYSVPLCGAVLTLKYRCTADAAVTVAISTPVQLFIAWRVKMLTQSYFFPTLIALLSVISLGGGISVTLVVSLHPDYACFGHFHLFSIIWLSSTAACDVTLSGALIYSLYTRKTGGRTTDRYVDKIIRLTVQSGSITAVTALLDLLVFLFTPGTTLLFIWAFPLPKLYTNALLSTQAIRLNARPWKDDAPSRYTVNMLFESFDETPTEQFSSAIDHAYAQPPLELHQRHRELSTFYAANRELTDDLDRVDVHKITPL
ncbi:hypothetical protein FB451DRAFT_1564162 [Mycena latifolia]|nr:hypothetical protein FB451DRAFT_1564162 [Mycena latifolia]